VAYNVSIRNRYSDPQQRYELKKIGYDLVKQKGVDLELDWSISIAFEVPALPLLFSVRKRENTMRPKSEFNSQMAMIR
jgi:hypothetical protein